MPGNVTKPVEPGELATVAPSLAGQLENGLVWMFNKLIRHCNRDNPAYTPARER
jgi:hypothetical protein